MFSKNGQVHYIWVRQYTYYTRILLVYHTNMGTHNYRTPITVLQDRTVGIGE
jgi:hypothetical protein